MFNLFKTGPAVESIDGQKFEELRSQKTTEVIDVRTPAEAAEAKVPGSKLINVMSGDFRSKVAKLDPAKTYLVYCRSGARSQQACKTMKAAGLEKVYNLSGGLGTWLYR